MTFSETMDALDNVRKSNAMSSEFFVEVVAYSCAVSGELSRKQLLAPVAEHLFYP